MSLQYIGQQITIYVGLLFVLVGVIGNGINILIFSTVRAYRTTPCTFYYLIGSIHSIGYITINLISRIVNVAFGIDLGRTSISWCKIRQFCLVSLSLIILSCSCLATIDQYFVTSRSANLRRLSNIKLAHRIVLIMIIVWCLHGIPYLLFYNISPMTNTCGNTNASFAIYVSVHILVLICAIPVLVLVIFGYLTYRNILLTRALAEQQADRQLTRTILIQVVLIVFCLVPLGINNTYNLITSGTSKNQDRLMIESFASVITGLLPFFFYTGSFYMFLISSSRFRRTVKTRMFFWQRQNQVVPDNPNNLQLNQRH